MTASILSYSYDPLTNTSTHAPGNTMWCGCRFETAAYNTITSSDISCHNSINAYKGYDSEAFI